MSLMSKCHCQVISSITTINNIKNPILNKWKHFTEGSVSWFSIFVMSRRVISMLGIIVVYDLNIEIPKFTSSYRGSIYNVSMFGIIVVYDLSRLKIPKFTCTHIMLICAYVIMQHFDPQSMNSLYIPDKPYNHEKLRLSIFDHVVFTNHTLRETALYMYN